MFFALQNRQPGPLGSLPNPGLIGIQIPHGVQKDDALKHAEHRLNLLLRSLPKPLREIDEGRIQEQHFVFRVYFKEPAVPAQKAVDAVEGVHLYHPVLRHEGLHFPFETEAHIPVDHHGPARGLWTAFSPGPRSRPGEAGRSRCAGPGSGIGPTLEAPPTSATVRFRPSKCRMQ